jgi:hypothetical protein
MKTRLRPRRVVGAAATTPGKTMGIIPNMLALSTSNALSVGIRCGIEKICRTKQTTMY